MISSGLIPRPIPPSPLRRAKIVLVWTVDSFPQKVIRLLDREGLQVKDLKPITMIKSPHKSPLYIPVTIILELHKFSPF